jgi:hypothetical protein
MGLLRRNALHRRVVRVQMRVVADYERGGREGCDELVYALAGRFIFPSSKSGMWEGTLSRIASSTGLSDVDIFLLMAGVEMDGERGRRARMRRGRAEGSIRTIQYLYEVL